MQLQELKEKSRACFMMWALPAALVLGVCLADTAAWSAENVVKLVHAPGVPPPITRTEPAT